MRQNKRQSQKEATRKKIIETAITAYSRDGFAVPSNVIAREAGVSHGTIFVHFPTLKDLLLCILQKFFVQIGGKLHDLSESSGSVREFLIAHIEALEAYEAFYGRLVTERHSLPDEARNVLASIQSVVSRHFEAVAAKETARGKIKIIPVQIMFNTWLGLIHYYLQNADSFAPGESVLKSCKEELADNFVILIQK
jgi:AcrR family transcriptional regulator